MMGYRQWLMFAFASVALAAPAALPHMLGQPEGAFTWAAEIAAVACTCVACVLTLVVTGRVGVPVPPLWSRVWFCLALAAAGPLAMDATCLDTRAYLAWPMLMLAVVCGSSRSGSARWLAAPVVMAAAGALDATALVWPLGYAGGCWALRRDRGQAGALLAAGVLGIGWNVVAGRPILTTYALHAVAYALHRDVLVSMAFILLGLSAAGRFWTRRADDDLGLTPWSVGWCGAGVVALLLIVVGVRLNPLLAVLPLGCMVPYALEELSRMIYDRAPEAVVARRIALLAAALAMVLAWPAARGWMRGVLLALACFG